MRFLTVRLYSYDMNKLIELRRAKMLALSLLLIAAATFVVTLFLPPNFWVSGVKAIAEAAMVGALADWFADYGDPLGEMRLVSRVFEM